MLVAILTSLFIVVSVCYVIYAFRRMQYWKRRGVPHLTGFPFLGSYNETNDPDLAWFNRISYYTQKLGKVWGYQEGLFRNVLVVADLDLVNDLLHKRFEEFMERKNHPFGSTKDSPRVHLAEAWGNRWKRLRAIVTPQFSNNALKRILPVVDNSAVHLANHIGKHCDKGTINIHSFYQEYTMDVISRVAMGVQGSTQWQSEYTNWLKGTFERDPRNLFFFLVSAFPFLRTILRESFIFFSKHVVKMPVTFIFEQIERAVERRKKEREAGDLHSNDFIDLFLDAEAEDLDYVGEGAYNRKGEINVQRKLTTDEVIAQCFVFLLAGFDTTANTLAYISHCLARHPDVQERMREEIDQICTTEEVNYDQLNDLKYMDCVVKEALRLHPPATVAISRVAEKDCEFAGIKLEKGTAIQVDAASIQRDKEIWGEDADEFLPERWMNLTKQQGQAYLAFGGGPRMCVGMRLGYSESKIALVHVLKRYALYIAPESKEGLTLRGAITVSPSEVPVRIQSRPLGD